MLTSLHAVNDMRTILEQCINQELKEMRAADAETRFQLRTEIKDLAFVANKIALVKHTVVDKAAAAATDAAVGKEVTIAIRHTHQYSPYIPDVDYDEMMYILRKRLQQLVRYELEMARKWTIDMQMPQQTEECLQIIDKYMLFAEKTEFLCEYDIEHTFAVQAACRKGNFSLNNIRYNLHND